MSTPPVTTPGKVIPTGPVQPKWPTTSLTPSATASGVAGCGVEHLEALLRQVAASRSTGAPLIPTRRCPRRRCAWRSTLRRTTGLTARAPPEGAAAMRSAARPCAGATSAAASARRSRRSSLGSEKVIDSSAALTTSTSPKPRSRQPLQDLLDQDLGHRGARGDADRGHALQPGLVDLVGEVHQVGGAGAGRAWRPRPAGPSSRSSWSRRR